MYILITILIIITCVLLILIVLVQNPKGGGLSGTFGGFSDQTMGVQRTNDFLEKSTWTLAVVLLAFSLLTGFFIDRSVTTEAEKESSAMEEQIQNAPLPFNVPQQQNGNSAPPVTQQDGSNDNASLEEMLKENNSEEK